MCFLSFFQRLSHSVSSPVTLAYLEEFDTKSEAMKREAALKKMTPPKNAEIKVTGDAKNIITSTITE